MRPKARSSVIMIALLAASCSGPAAPAAAPTPPPAKASAPSAASSVAAPTAAQQAAPAPQHFGAKIDSSTPELALSALLAAPAEHAGKTIRARGTIQRVCQRMGCWMELQGDGASSAVRVPMADHAFFLPQSVVGRRAEIQGQVSVAALSEGHKRHLESEGAKATEANVSIAATGVAVR